MDNLEITYNAEKSWSKASVTSTECYGWAGTGNLIQALINNASARLSIVAVERNINLFNLLNERFYNLPNISFFNDCFLEYAQRLNLTNGFTKIIMNPPFKKVKSHMDAALSLLDRTSAGGSSLVALVPVTYQHSDAQLMEELPVDSFAHIKVNTKIIQFNY